MGDQRRLTEYALALNDSIVQGLAAAKMALELGESDRAERMITDTLTQARTIISDLLREVGVDLQPGDLIREEHDLVEGDGGGGSGRP